MSVEGGGLAGVAPLMVGNFSTIVNEGSVRGSLEGFRPMNASDINTVDKGGTIAPSQPLVIQQAEEVAAKAWELSEPLKAEAVVAEANHWLGISDISTPSVILNEVKDLKIQSRDSSPCTDCWYVASLIAQNDKLDIPQVEPVVAPLVAPNIVEYSRSQPVVSPALEPVIKTGLSPKVEARVSHRISQAVLPQLLLQEQEVEEEVLEKVTVEEPKESLEEEEMVEKRMYLEDEEALAQRRYEVKEAVGKAKTEADRLGFKKIAGWLVAKFLPAEHPGNRSQVVKEHGPDGSYEETVEAISLTGEFDSERQARERLNGIVTEKKPVKHGKDGTPVKKEDVDRVFKNHVVKPTAAAHEIAITRVVKKKVHVSAGQARLPSGQAAVEPKSEASLEDYPELVEVFQKAA